MVETHPQGERLHDRAAGMAAAIAVLAATAWLVVAGASPAAILVGVVAGVDLVLASVGPARGTEVGIVAYWLAIGFTIALGSASLLGSLAALLYFLGAVLAGSALRFALCPPTSHKFQPPYVVAQALAFGLTVALIRFGPG